MSGMVYLYQNVLENLDLYFKVFMTTFVPPEFDALPSVFTEAPWRFVHFMTSMYELGYACVPNS